MNSTHKFAHGIFTPSILKIPVFSFSRLNPWIYVWLGVLFIFFYKAWGAFFSQGLDFAIYYSVGEAIISGNPTTMYHSGEQAPWISYAPLVTPTFYYFALVPFKHAKIAFFLLKPVAYASWPFLLAASISKKEISERALSAAAIACIAMTPSVYEETIVGNINVFLLTALFGAAVFARRGKVFLAAVIITAIAVCKPQYSLFWIPVFFMRPMAAIAGGFTGVGLLLAHTLIFLTPTELIEMLQKWVQLISTPIAPTADVNNMSTSGVIERMLTPLGLTESRGLQNINVLQMGSATASTIAKLAAAIFSLIGAATIIPVFKSLKNDDDGYALWLTAIAIMTLFITPVIWLTHYMLMVVALFGVVYKMSFRSPTATLFIAFLVGYAIYAAGQFLNSDAVMQVYARAFGWPFAALALLLFGLVTCLYKSERAAT